MSTEVVTEISLNSKSGTAYVARVRLLSRVDTLMVLKGDKLGKRCTAYTTAERTLASMRPLMTVQMAYVRRLVCTELTVMHYHALSFLHYLHPSGTLLDRTSCC